MTDFDAVKKLATLPVRTVSLCLAGDLVDEYARLERQLAELKPATNLGDGADKRVILEQMVDIRGRMQESTVDFRLQAIPARPFALFNATRPTRKADKDGEFTEPAEEWEPRIFAWQADLVSRTCADPVMNVEQVGELVDMLHAGSWSQLYSAAYVLNLGEVDIPNSEAASELIRSSEQT